MDGFIAFIAANSVLALVYAIVECCHRRPGRGIGLGIFFLFLPGLGFVIYFFPIVIQEFLRRKGVDREAILTHELAVEHQPEHPDVRAELNVVPVEDAMAISSNAEKRSLLLTQMERNWKSNPTSLLAAERDSDSETAHYAAAEQMEIYRTQQARWLDARKEYERHPESPKSFHRACEALMDLLASGVFSRAEQSAYRERLCDLVQGWIESDPGSVTEDECEACLRALVDLHRYDEADRLWARYGDKMQDENAYRDMMKMYYEQGDRLRFEAILHRLRDNEDIRLSAEGLSQMRYWTSRIDDNRANAADPAASVEGEV